MSLAVSSQLGRSTSSNRPGPSMRAHARATPATGGPSSDSALAGQVKSTMKEQFREKAKDPAAFHALLETVYGAGYDREKAEDLRRKALAGDDSWLPKVEFVDSEGMNGGNGAYDAKSGVVYIDRKLAQRDPALAASTYVEEAGHHLDTMLKTSDTRGDEGEMFRRLMAGEKLTAAQLRDIRSENDKGTITVAGKQVEVEFFIGKALKKVGKAFSDGAKAVANGAKKVVGAVKDGAETVGNYVAQGVKTLGESTVKGAKEVGNFLGNLVGGAWNGAKKAGSAVVKGAKKVGGAVIAGAKKVGSAVASGAKAIGKGIGKAASWVWTGVKQVATGAFEGVKKVGEGFAGALKHFGSGVFEATVGVGKNLFKGDFGAAAKSLVNGLDRAIFQSTQRFFTGALNGAKSAADGFTDMLGPLGKPLRSVTDRAHDIASTALDTAFGVGRDAFRLIPDAAAGFIGDLEKSIELALDGRFGDAAKQFGMAFVNVPGRIAGGMFDMTSRMLQGIASAGQTAVGAEPVALRFSDLPAQQQEFLRRIYGNSIDYDQVRIKLGGPLNKAMSPHAVGNTIYMPQNFDNRRMFDNGRLTQDGLNVLGHELGHVWQNQNGGGSYIHDAIAAQAGGAIENGDAGTAYDWVRGMNEGKSFRELNPEQQSRLMEHLVMAAGADGEISTGDGMTLANLQGGARNLTTAEVEYLNRAWREVRGGQRVI